MKVGLLLLMLLLMLLMMAVVLLLNSGATECYSEEWKLLIHAEDVGWMVS